MTQIAQNIDNKLYKNGVAQEDNFLTLTEGQEKAIKSIVSWYNGRHSISFKKYFVLAGAAGCVLPETRIKVRKVSNEGRLKIVVISREYTSYDYSKSDLENKNLTLSKEVELPISEFFEISKNGGTFEIETPDGWQRIGQLFIKKEKSCGQIVLEDGTLCRVSLDHLFMTDSGWKFMKNLHPESDLIQTSTGLKKILKKERIGTHDTYDLEVLSESHAYYSNGIVSHNTGKSSVIQYIIESLGIPRMDVLCGALTGKATLNLRRKGNTGSNTLHSSIYDCEITKDGPVFHLKSKIYYRLIIIDEASMISEDLFNDIMSFGIPTIFIGDHCQLPPVDGNFNIMLQPDFVLTEIMRQAAESPIIRASQLVIRGEERKIPFCYDEKFKFRKIKESELKDEDFIWADQIVCGFNKTRKALNEICREVRGYKGYSPNYGERMVVLKNNRKYNVWNGQIIYIMSNPSFNFSDKTWSCKFIDELEYSGVHGLVCEEKNLIYKVMDPPLTNRNNDRMDISYLDYGYVLSVHKAQGSGWKRVMIYNEPFGFGDKETYRRWLYTAITRAKEEILLVMKG